jgi:hypothetical protein
MANEILKRGDHSTCLDVVSIQRRREKKPCNTEWLEE